MFRMPGDALAADCRPILMNGMNRHLPQSAGSMENRNYTVEPWRASKTPSRVRIRTAKRPESHSQISKKRENWEARPRSRMRLKKLHFNQDGIKRGRVAHVREFFRSQHVDVAVAGCKFCPIELCRNHSRWNHSVHLRLQRNLATVVENPHRAAVRNPPRGRVGRVDLEPTCLFERLQTGQIGERRVQKIVGFTRQHLEWIALCPAGMPGFVRGNELGDRIEPGGPERLV